MDLGASQQCVICGFKVFKKNNFGAAQSSKFLVNVLLTKFSYFAVAKSFFFFFFFFFTKNTSKIGYFRLKSTRMQKVLQGTFWENCRIQIQIYHQTSIVAKD
jgi:hypothetical protein